MTLIERFQALLDGKKIRNKSLVAKFYRLRVAKEAGPYTILDDDGTDCYCDLHYFLDPNEEWEIYEEPMPEIKLTPEDVGKRVRFADGRIELILSYEPSERQLYQFGSSGENFDENGRTELDIIYIVEVLP